MSTTTSKSLNMNSVNHGRLSQRFDLIRKLGQGTYGKVQLGINKLTGVEVALKTIKKCKIESSSDLLRIKREITIMSCCNHPNIIHIYEVYENKEKIILVMEYAEGGELYDYLNEKKKLDDDEAKRIFAQIASAIYYCHKHQITHRDLKLENVLLDKNLNAKIADFGLSNVYGDQLLKTFCGSPLYASPEIVKGIPYHGPEVDCWSLGVLLYTLVYGSMPFDGTHFKKLVKQITSGSFYEPTIKSGAAELIRALLTVDSKRRYTIHQVVCHAWLMSTECHSISEEYCNLAPVKGEYLMGINKSDTLDEVSEISSTSIEDTDADAKATKQSPKPKPPRKPKPSECEPPLPQPPVIEPVQVKSPEDKAAKPNDKPKTDIPKVNEPSKVKGQTDKPKPSELTKPETVPKDAAVKAPESETSKNEKVSPAPARKSEKVSPVPVRKEASPAPAQKETKSEKVSPVPVGKSNSPAPAQKEVKVEKLSPVPVKKPASPSPAHKSEKETAQTPSAVKNEQQAVKTDDIRKEAKPVVDSETKDQRKPKSDEKATDTNKNKEISKPETLKLKTETKQKSPAKETNAENCQKLQPVPPTAPVVSVPLVKSEVPVVPETTTPVPAVTFRNQRSTSTPTSEEASSPTTPVPAKTERRNSKTISPKTAELIQNLTISESKGDSAEVAKKAVAPLSKLSDIKKKFENGQPPKSDESGIGSLLRRRKSIVESGELEGQEVKVTPAETTVAISPVPPVVTNQQQAPATVTSVTRSVKPPPASKTPTAPKVLNLVIERESDHVTPSLTIKPEVVAPVSRPALKLIMPKPVAKVMAQPPASASPPITKQGAVKKIGSLINKAKSNEITAAHSGSRERVIPIQFEDDLSSPVSRSGTGSSGSRSPRTGSISVSILPGDVGTPSSRTDSRSFVSHGSPASTISSPSYSRHNSFGNEVPQQHNNSIGGCQIMKSKREFIIPITIEARNDNGDMTPGVTDLLTRRNSSSATASSSGASSSSRVYSSRRHTSSNLSLLSPDSTDLDDDFFDDDDFLSSDALFTSLLQRVRGLRIGDRGFNDNKTPRRNGRWATNLDFKRN